MCPSAVVWQVLCWDVSLRLCAGVPSPCREELKALRKQMAEIEKSMTEQLFTNQQRAQEAYVSGCVAAGRTVAGVSDCCCACVCRVS